MQQEEITIQSQETLARLVQDEAGLLLYCGAPDCGVCTALKPKALDLLRTYFPRLRYAYLDCARHPEVAAQLGVFGVPTVLVYLAGREALRRTRNFSIAELSAALQRPYGMLFDD